MVQQCKLPLVNHKCSDGKDDKKLSNTPNIQSFTAMGEYNSGVYAGIKEIASPGKISVVPLVFLIFYEVSGGPFGVENSVQAAGPLLALVGFLVFPLIWSLPVALMTAEMGTMFPENAGYVVWAQSAFGSYWGFQQGWIEWLSGVLDNALYPVLFLDHLNLAIPALNFGIPRVATVSALTVILTYLNYRGLAVVGWLAVLFGVSSLLPFVVMGFIAIPKIEPSRWLVVDIQSVDWRLFLHTLCWNLNCWDSVSTIAGEVRKPKRYIPKTLFKALILVVLGHFLPLLIGTGAMPLNRELWTDGYFLHIAKVLGGGWLTWWIHGATAVSKLGMFVAEMSSDSFQLLGMAERGMLPEFFGDRSRYGTPLAGIVLSASGVISLAWLNFQEILAVKNLLYCFGMILEFLTFLKLKIKDPDATRPFKAPGGTFGAMLMCIPPTILIGIVFYLASLKVMGISFAAVAIGLVMQPCLQYLEDNKWLKFSISPDLPDIHSVLHRNTESLVD